MQVQASRSRVGIELSKLELSETSLTRNQELIQNELESLEDPAEQIAELTREQILQNARIAVLAQANLQQQIVLQLLQLD
jgi:flagellin-like hook-associated protein FlgL